MELQVNGLNTSVKTRSKFEDVQLTIAQGDGCPWGNLTAYNANPDNIPQTNRIVYYDWTITREPLAPDGFSKDVLLINGQFPGPTLEANWGDTISVTVHNRIVGPEEGTGIHFHGLRQKGTPWMDGVPSVSACPIVPGENFT